MREAPHFYVSGEFDVTDALRALPNKIRINDLLLYLTAQTLLRVPELNAIYEDDRLFQFDHVHLGIAVALEDGLLTPVLRHTERYSLQGIADESRSLIERAREKRLRPDDLQGGTFTVSNLGMVKQVERFTAVINPPQVGILAAGTVKERPVVIDGGLHIRSTVYLTLSGDHRAVDGMHLARFLAVFQEQLTAFSK
jgi:pyruvate dehydrogenase E2 component (dihydrolipoamide acetyltransferase)